VSVSVKRFFIKKSVLFIFIKIKKSVRKPADLKSQNGSILDIIYCPGSSPTLFY